MDNTDRNVLLLMFIVVMVAITAVLNKVENQCGPAAPAVKFRVAV